jgi:Family of unknown function (DUF6064)
MVIRRDNRDVNWAAAYFAWGFELESALLIGVGILRGPLTLESPADRAGRAGLGMFLFALAAEPLAASILGRGWRAVGIFGVAPDPTAIATLGILLLVRVRGRWLLFVLPAIWRAVSGATLLAMKSPDAWIPPLAAVVAIVGAVRQARERRRNGRTGSTPTGTPPRASAS